MITEPGDAAAAASTPPQGGAGPAPEAAAAAPGRAAGMLDPRLLEILVCPVSKTTLRYDVAAQELVSEAAGLAYPIREGVPIMLIDQARVLDPHGR